MKRVGLRELKTHLSGYIRRVRRGESLQLTDRGEVVAEVVPPRAVKRGGAQAALDAAVMRGEVWPAVDRKAWPFRGWKGVGVARGVSQRILDELRGEGPG